MLPFALGGSSPWGQIFSRELSLSGPWACYTAPTCTCRPQRNGITNGWCGIALFVFLNREHGMSIAEQKAALREVAKKNRKEAVSAAGETASDQFTANLLTLAGDLGVGPRSVVAGYRAMSSELNVTPALQALAENVGATCVLPVVVGKDQPLIFREWFNGLELEPGGFGTHHPPASQLERLPDLLMIPLLAFDRTGYRLGWGGGFYDRTVGGYREKGHQIVAIGAAYAGQEVDAVAHDHLDQPVDWIVTETDVFKAHCP